MLPEQDQDLDELALLEAEDFARAENSLAHFTRSAWDILEPETQYLHNWHIDLISEYLTAVEQGDIRRLIINIPPRYMKSLQVTVCFPAWVWTRKPAKRFIAASYAASLSIAHSVARRTLIESDWYQRGWGDKFELASDQNQKTEFQNTHRGHMIAASVGGAITGRGGDILIVDDPLNPLEAASDIEREAANTWFDLTFTSRLDNKKTGAIIVVMQRLHEKDLTGHLLAKGGWEHLKLPVEATSKTTIVFPISKREIVREEGQVLWPERDGPKELEQTKKDLGPIGYPAQMQQDPKPAGGGFFHRSWWKRYQELPMRRIRRVQFWDCAEVPGVTNDFSVCATWDQTESGYYLVDLWANKVAFPQLEQACKDLYAAYNPDAIVIEKKSAGIQLLQNLGATTTLPIIPFEPGGVSKEVRAAGAQPTVAAGNCHLPENRPWVELFLSRHEKFPRDEHDDEVDTTSMMVAYFKNPTRMFRVREVG